MAKGKDGKQKLKVPKKIAGVKVPKEVRKAADPVLRALDNPLVADIAAAALVAAAGALTERRKPGRSKGAAADNPGAASSGSLNGAFSVLAAKMADKAMSALETLEQRVTDKGEPTESKPASPRGKRPSPPAP